MFIECLRLRVHFFIFEFVNVLVFQAGKITVLNWSCEVLLSLLLLSMWPISII